VIYFVLGQQLLAVFCLAFEMSISFQWL